MDFNPLVGGRHPDAVRKIFGEDVVLSGVSPELTLAAIVANDRREHFFPQAEFLFSGVRTAAALAANNSGVGILNPVGSGLLVTVEAYIADQNHNVGILESPQTILGAIAGVTLVSALDSRAILLSPQPIQMTAFQRGAVPNLCNFGVANIERPWYAVLFPGSQQIWWNTTQNTELTLAVRGYARKFKIEELSTGG